jgi:hypothetical protein
MLLTRGYAEAVAPGNRSQRTGYTLVLGKNEIRECKVAIVIKGEEVFRIRQRDTDGNLVVDFDVRAADGTPIARVWKNYVDYVAPGYEFRTQRGVVQVVDTTAGTAVARVQALSPTHFRVTGRFCAKGYTVEITDDVLRAGPRELRGQIIDASRKAVYFGEDVSGIGLTD